MKTSLKLQASQVESTSRKLFSLYHQTLPLANGYVTKVRNPPRRETGFRISDWTHCWPSEGYKLSISVLCTRYTHTDTVLLKSPRLASIDCKFVVRSPFASNLFWGRRLCQCLRVPVNEGRKCNGNNFGFPVSKFEMTSLTPSTLYIIYIYIYMCICVYASLQEACKQQK